MANRVTVTEVKQIIDISASIEDADVEVMITAANILATKVNTDGGMTDATQLKEIERWLSAHFQAIRDMRSSSEKARSVSQGFQYKLGLNFNVTMYGQQALILDTTGTLAQMQIDAAEGTYTAELSALGPVSDEDADITR